MKEESRRHLKPSPSWGFAFLWQLDPTDEQACEHGDSARLLTGRLLPALWECERMQTPWQSLSGEAEGALGSPCSYFGCRGKAEDTSLLSQAGPLAFPSLPAPCYMAQQRCVA